MAMLQTIKGLVSTESLGLMLPHEHLFVDLRGPFAPHYGEAEPEAVDRPRGDRQVELGELVFAGRGQVVGGEEDGFGRGLLRLGGNHGGALTGLRCGSGVPVLPSG